MKQIIIGLFIVFALSAEAQFVHPGMLHDKKDLEMLKKNVQTGKEPWATAWSQLQSSPEADLNYQPKPIKVIVVGFYSKPDIGATAFQQDANAAYTLALQYSVNRQKAYAEKSIEIMNAWSYTLDSITDNNKKLLMGIVGVKFLNAAEIIRHTYNGWKKKDQQEFEKMALTIWYPLIEDFMPGYNGNWDAAIIQTMMCIGIFCDRKDIFDKAYNQALKGESNGAINNYFNEWGQCQESGRDQGHTQMGLGFMSTVCEIAWKQGYDLYGAYDNRIAKGYEYTAKYLLGEEVKYVRYKNYQGRFVFSDTISPIGRGRFSPIFERAYNHYNKRKGMEMPYTLKALEKSRIEKAGIVYMPWATLMHYSDPK